MSADPAGLGDAALQRLLDDERHDQAIVARRREQSLRAQASESGTLLGVMADLAERRAPTSLSTTGGRMVQGVIIGLGADVVIMRGPASKTVLVALDAVASVRAEPGTVRSTGDREVRSSATLAHLLAEFAVERPQVVIHAGSTAVAGELRAVGVDVATVETTDQAVAYVAIATVTEVVLS